MKKMWPVLALAIILGGCTVAQYTRMGPNSHFAYPNSNVRDLGPVSIKTTGAGGWALAPPSFITSDIDEKVYNKALAQQQGADVIVDYIRTTQIKCIPYVAIWSEEYLEGRAGQMEVGKQHLVPGR